MKIVVTELPVLPADCLFSRLQNGHWVCCLHENIPGKPDAVPCVCHDTEKCTNLIKVGDAP